MQTLLMWVSQGLVCCEWKHLKEEQKSRRRQLSSKHQKPLGHSLPCGLAFPMVKRDAYGRASQWIGLCARQPGRSNRQPSSSRNTFPHRTLAEGQRAPWAEDGLGVS